MYLRDIGEKDLIRSLIKPLFNPTDQLGSIGDDCAVLEIPNGKCVCLSTDRVPADLISFQLGLIDYTGLGYYLAVLNISDIAANGATPVGLLLTFAFPDEFLFDDLKSILNGVKKACDQYGCKVLGGDLSHSVEMSISATSIGIAKSGRVLYRRGAISGDRIFCSDYLGLASTAFHYFLQAKGTGLYLSGAEEAILINQFREPKARLELSRKMADASCRLTCMDNTDGVGQTFSELAELNGLRFELDRESLPIHELSVKVANFLDLDILRVILGGGADFQLLGTIEEPVDAKEIGTLISRDLRIIGKTSSGSGVWIREPDGRLDECKVPGWDYYAARTRSALPG